VADRVAEGATQNLAKSGPLQCCASTGQGGYVGSSGPALHLTETAAVSRSASAAPDPYRKVEHLGCRAQSEPQHVARSIFTKSSCVRSSIRATYRPMFLECSRGGLRASSTGFGCCSNRRGSRWTEGTHGATSYEGVGRQRALSGHPGPDLTHDADGMGHHQLCMGDGTAPGDKR
jgi:hypothetical protein